MLSPLVVGDSLAVGIGSYTHAVVDARVGATSQEGLRRARRHGNAVVYASMGANDPASAWRPFRSRVRLVLQGRECVAWLTVPRRPAFNRVLRREAASDSRLHIVSGVRTVDGIHPDAGGYRTLARRMRRACA